MITQSMNIFRSLQYSGSFINRLKYTYNNSSWQKHQKVTINVARLFSPAEKKSHIKNKIMKSLETRNKSPVHYKYTWQRYANQKNRIIGWNLQKGALTMFGWCLLSGCCSCHTITPQSVVICSHVICVNSYIITSIYSGRDS